MQDIKENYSETATIKNKKTKMIEHKIAIKSSKSWQMSHDKKLNRENARSLQNLR